MRISACIHNDPVVIEADFMDLVYHLTFHVTLKISNLTLWIALLLASAGAVTATTLYGRKKKHNVK